MSWSESKEFLLQKSIRFQRFFKWTEILSSVYFVFISAVPQSKVSLLLSNIGFRSEISNTIASSIYSIWTILIIAICLIIAKGASNLVASDAKSLNDQLKFEIDQNAIMSETLSSLTPSLRSFYGFTLESILRKVKLDDSPNVRISAYILSSDKQNFVPVGRYSHNALFRTQGRTFLPFSEGCISTAWRVGKEEWREMSKNDDVRKKKSLQSYNIPEETFDGFRMKSISMAAHRIDDTSKSPVGIVVIESDQHGLIDFEVYERVLNDEKANIQRLISSTHQYLTDPALALEADV